MFSLSLSSFRLSTQMTPESVGNTHDKLVSMFKTIRNSSLPVARHCLRAQRNSLCTALHNLAYVFGLSIASTREHVFDISGGFEVCVLSYIHGIFCFMISLPSICFCCTSGTGGHIRSCRAKIQHAKAQGKPPSKSESIKVNRMALSLIQGLSGCFSFVSMDSRIPGYRHAHHEGRVIDLRKNTLIEAGSEGWCRWRAL